MSQTFTDDCFDPLHDAQTDLQNMENNFAALKSCFSGASAPSSPVAGMWWFDTTNNLLKIRNEANTGWQSVWDFGNNRVPPAAVTSMTALAACNFKYVHPAGQQCTLDGVSLADIEDGTVMLPFSMHQTETAYENATSYWVSQTKYRVYIPATAQKITMAARIMRYEGAGTGYCKFIVGASSSVSASTTLDIYTWVLTATLDVSGLSGWYDLDIQLYHAKLQGFSFVWVQL